MRKFDIIFEELVEEPKSTQEESCCSGSCDCDAAEEIEASPTEDGTAVEFTRVSSELTTADKWGMFRCRTGSRRNDYRVATGLYAVGEPDASSDVFVSANYKYSFDVLRSQLAGINAWILVLDTRGINVWCAAGKGTFGTEELVKRIAATGLRQVVSHNRLIVPQLGAVGVSAADVRRATGFRVKFGPVHAIDIPAYIESGYHATREMRTISFPVWQRLILTPMELFPALKKYPLYGLLILLVFGLQRSGILFDEAFSGGFPFLIMGLVSVLAGAFLTPIMLPWIPFRSFAVKGWVAGAAALAATIVFLPGMHPLLLAASLIFFPMASSYIALQFTGSTTFTGMSGVRKELKIGIPLYLAALTVAGILLIGYKVFVDWRMF
jgi:hypothetical protein